MDGVFSQEVMVWPWRVEWVRGVARLRAGIPAFGDADPGGDEGAPTMQRAIDRCSNVRPSRAPTLTGDRGAPHLHDDLKYRGAHLGQP
jgi:hypothetical protein